VCEQIECQMFGVKYVFGHIFLCCISVKLQVAIITKKM